MKVRNETGPRSQPRTRHFELRCRAVEFFFGQAQERPSTLPSMAFTLPLIAALLGGSLVSQVPLQVQPYRGGSEEESSAEEPRPISRCALDQTLLSLLFLGAEDGTGRFLQNLLDPPSTASVKAATASLEKMGALEDTGSGKLNLSPLGMHLAGIPAPPTIGKSELKTFLLYISWNAYISFSQMFLFFSIFH